MNKFEIRLAGLSDVPALAWLAGACFESPWTAEQLNHAVSGENSCIFAAFSDNAGLVGMLALSAVLDEGSVDDVAVAPEYRRGGIADALLPEADIWARERGLAFLTLEVRASNAPAIALYDKHGFISQGLRRGYYEKPREDAVIMTKFFTEES